MSYAHEDKALKEMFDLNLKVLSQQGLITTWTDKNLRGGDVWNDIIEGELRSADIILFMVSNAFLASDFIRENEVRISMELEAEKKAVIVPVILKHCGWREEKWAGKQPLPSLVKAVTDWEEKDREKGFADVEKGLRELLKWLQRRKTSAPAISYPPQGDGDRETSLRVAPWRKLAAPSLALLLLAAVAWFAWRAGHSSVSHDAMPKPDQLAPGQPRLVETPPSLPAGPGERWSLPEDLARITVTGSDGKSVDGNVVQAALQPTYTYVDPQTNARHSYTDGASFWLKFQSKRGDIPGPWTVSFFTKAVAAPQRPTGELAMSAGLPLLPKPVAQGYTYAWSFNMNPFKGGTLKEGVIAQEACGFLLGLGENKRGFIPVGEHEVGLQILGKDQEPLFRSNIRINVRDWAVPEKDCKLTVTDMAGVSIEDGHEIPATRAGPYTEADPETKAPVTATTGLNFGLKFLTKEAVAGPWTIVYYLRATTAPEPPNGFHTMSVAPRLLLSAPLPEGYTASASWSLYKDEEIRPKNTEAVIPNLTFYTGDDRSQQGEITKGVHSVGIEVKVKEESIYRGVVKLKVE